MTSSNLTAMVVGLVLGGVVAVVWHVVETRLGKFDFWPEIAKLTQGLLADDADFFKQYSRLLKLLGIYLGRNLLIVGLSFLPVAVFVLLALPPFMEHYNSRADRLEVHPPQRATIAVADVKIAVDPDGRSLIPMPSAHGAGSVTIDSGTLNFESLLSNNVFCDSNLKSLGFALLGFEVHQVEQEHSMLILRPFCGDSNVFWPFLSDPEFAFYVALTVGSLLGMVVVKIRKSRP